MRDAEPSTELGAARSWLERFLAEHPGGGRDELASWMAAQTELAARPELLAEVRVLFEQWLRLGRLADLFVLRRAGTGGFFGPGVGTPDAERACAADGAARDNLRVGASVGPYELRRFIAQGGMGQVWEALDRDLRRAVALKLMLPERIDARGLERFAREARAGGRLAHPNVVTTLAHGSDQGWAWIAQELVEGSWTLKDFLDERRAGGALPRDYYRRAAELVARLADALQAAHAAGVVHRDVKPQNVLIAPDGTPKLTDFGLARVKDDSFVSRTDDLAGTFNYMSPEQVTARGAALDHRTDVFSLGIVLYELLTLRRPFEGDTTHQVVERILHFDPPEASRIRSQCPRDLSIIAAKALDKQPSRRYASMAELAEDLRRHLANEPIRARPPGTCLRALKWTRRNPALSSASAVGLLALAILSGLLAANLRTARELAVTVGALQRTNVDLREQTELARSNAALAEERRSASLASEQRARAGEEEAWLQQQLAQQRERELGQIASFQASMLERIDLPALGAEIVERLRDAVAVRLERERKDPGAAAEHLAQFDMLTAALPTTDLASALVGQHILDRSSAALEQEFADQPSIELRMRVTLGKVYHAIGLDREARAELERALELALAVPEHDERMELAVRHELGIVLLRMKDLDALERQVEPVLERGPEVLGEDHQALLMARNSHAMLLNARGETSAAARLLRELLEQSERLLGPEDRASILLHRNLAEVLLRQGVPLEAERHARASLEGAERGLPEDDALWIQVLDTLAQNLVAQRRFAEAEPYQRSALSLSRELRGTVHFQTADVLAGLGVLLLGARRPEDAEPYVREAFQLHQILLGPLASGTISSLNSLGDLLRMQRRPKEAEEALRDCLERLRQSESGDLKGELFVMNNLALALTDLSRTDEAEGLYREVLRRGAEAFGRSHPLGWMSLSNLASCLTRGGRSREALELLLEEWSTLRELPGEWHFARVNAGLHLGEMLRAASRFVEAEELYLEMDRALAEEDPTSRFRRSLAGRVVLLYEQRHREEPDHGHDQRAAEWRARLEPPTVPGD